MQLFLDNPALYSTATIPEWWVGGTNGNVQIVNTPLPPNSQAGAQVIYFDLESSNGSVAGNNYGNNARLIGATRYMRIAGGAAGFIMSFVNSTGIGTATTVCGVQADAFGTYITNGSGTKLATGPIIPALAWHHYELDVIFGTAGNATLTLYVDGSPTPFLQATAQTLTYAYGQVFQLGNSAPGGVGGQSAGGWYDDSYLLNGVTGPGGAIFTQALAPQGYGGYKTGYALMNGPGITSAWTPNGAATDWQCTITIPPASTPYASSSTPGQSFFGTLSSIPNITAVLSTQLSTYAMESDAGPRSIQSGFYSGGTYAYSGTNRFLSGTSQYFFDEYELNPVTATPWTPTSLSSIQMGVELTN